MTSPVPSRSFLGPTAALVAALAVAACGSPPIASSIEGEPVCSDFEFGASRVKMRGSLRFPVQVTVHDGDDQIGKTTLYGHREPSAAASRVLMPDADVEVEVRWGQCENERAPRPVQKGTESRDTAAYECGKAEVYKTDKLVLKKGDLASRKLTFVAPPKAECWLSEPPPGAADTAAPDAGAPPPVDAGAPPPVEADAGTATDAGAAADAGTAPAADAGTATAADAGAVDAGVKKKRVLKTPGPSAPRDVY